MKLLTKETDYAIRALIHLALTEQGYVAAKQISEKETIPYQYLRRILQTLCDQKILVSKEGAGGGVKLIKDAAEIKILDIITIFQGPFQLMSCMFRKNICPNRSKCVLKKKINQIEAKVIEEFEDITIGELVNDIKQS